MIHQFNGNSFTTFLVNSAILDVDIFFIYLFFINSVIIVSNKEISSFVMKKNKTFFALMHQLYKIFIIPLVFFS